MAARRWTVDLVGLGLGLDRRLGDAARRRRRARRRRGGPRPASPPGRRSAQRRAHDRRLVGMVLVGLVDADDDGADRHPDVAAHDDDGQVGVADDVVRRRAEQQPDLARSGVADDDHDVLAAGRGLLGQVDDRLARVAADRSCRVMRSSSRSRSTVAT